MLVARYEREVHGGAGGTDEDDAAALARWEKVRDGLIVKALGFPRAFTIRDYHADVTLTPDGDGTHIRWHSTFRPRVPATGWLIRRTLQRFVADTAERLARAAEQR